MSSEALVADFQRSIQLRDSHPQGTKVSCWNDNFEE